jgi:hypothetical protein
MVPLLSRSVRKFRGGRGLLILIYGCDAGRFGVIRAAPGEPRELDSGSGITIVCPDELLS